MKRTFRDFLTPNIETGVILDELFELEVKPDIIKLVEASLIAQVSEAFKQSNVKVKLLIPSPFGVQVDLYKKLNLVQVGDILKGITNVKINVQNLSVLVSPN